MKSLLEVFFSGSKLSSANLVLGAKPEVKFPVVLNHLQPEGKRNLKGRGRMEKKIEEKRKWDTNHIDLGVKEENIWRNMAGKMYRN